MALPFGGVFHSGGEGSPASTATLYLRRLGELDIPRLIGLERQCFSTAWQEEQFRLSFRQKVFVAFGLFEQPLGLIGYVSLYHLANEMEILNIAVDSKKRCQGYGSRLLSQVLDFGKQLSVERVTLEVRPSNVSARNLYARFGFTQVRIRPCYYPDTNEDALVYEVTL